MLQSTYIKALFTIKNETGEIANKIQRVGINFTLSQNIVNIPIINKMFANSKIPMNPSLYTFDPYEHICFKKYNNETTTRPTPTKGI